MRIRPLSVASTAHGQASAAEALISAAVLAALATSVPAQRQFDELAKRGLPVDRDTTAAVAMGDLDGDGDLDLVFGSSHSSGGLQKRLYLNGGDGNYTDATPGRMPTGLEGTKSVAVGDVDGDGDLDLMFANSHGQQNQLFTNDGTGFFTDVTGTRMPVVSGSSYAVGLADVDGDGDLDAVIGNDRQQNRLYLNDGTGTFIDATARLPVDSDWTFDVALGDVDRDGDIDIVCGNRVSSRYGPNRLYLNDGVGNYTDVTATHMPASTDDTLAVALGDVDGDGDLDLVLANYRNGGPNRLYLNNGSGTFADASSTRLAPDIDTTQDVVLADVDVDGDLDIVFANRVFETPPSQNRLHLNDGSGTFTEASAAKLPADDDHTVAMAAGDVDGDGDPDLVTGNRYQQDRLYLNDGTGGYIDATAPRMPTHLSDTTAAALGDVDMDGDLDAIFGNRLQNQLYLNDGNGVFSDVTSAQMPVNSDWAFAVALGDVDLDGDLDVVLASTPQTELYLNDGTGTFVDATATRLPSGSSRDVVQGDVDGDSDVDLVLARYPHSRLYLNDGTGTYTDATAARMPGGMIETRAFAMGDVDGDGDPDLILGVVDYTGWRSWQNLLYLNDGTGTYTDATASRMPIDSDWTEAIALGDVDSDGDLDILLGNSGQWAGREPGGQNRLYLNDGTGVFADATATSMPIDTDWTEAVALGDMDGDGDLDIVIGNRREQNRLYLNDGSGGFTDATAARMPTVREYTHALVLGDVDGDGDNDMVVGNRVEPNRVHMNLLSQLDAPFVARVGRSYTLNAFSRTYSTSSAEIALPFISTAPARIPVPPFGTFGLDPAQVVVLVPFFIPQPAGVESIDFRIPNVPALSGRVVYAQALWVPPLGQAKLTSIVADRLR